jgi:hypothetical protein
LIITRFSFALLDEKADSSRGRFSGGLEMTGALLRTWQIEPYRLGMTADVV